MAMNSDILRSKLTILLHVNLSSTVTGPWQQYSCRHQIIYSNGILEVHGLNAFFLLLFFVFVCSQFYLTYTI